MLRSLFTLATIALLCLTAHAQELSQTVRGSVFENLSSNAITGAEVVCICNSNEVKTLTDSTGNFRLKVPVGRQAFIIRKAGFVDYSIQNLDVGAGKEVVLQIRLEEKIVTLKEATVTVTKDPKENPLNSMSVVSARQFSVEETQRFAAAVNDPARMALGFAGVVAPDDGNNMIVIRGNTPSGLIWRMEGLDIPNPNHFSNVATSGGGITILSAQLLSNSDFLTGAFPAEYGNGISGVFDMKLRKGNNEKKEFTLQAGFLGLDLATEGPIGKKMKGSYLINYRYSTLSILAKIVPDITDAVTNFQDLSYHVVLPLNRKLTWSFFGFGGLSNQFAKAKKDTLLWQKESWRALDWNFLSNTGFTGTKLSWQPGKRHQIELKSGYGVNENGYNEKELNKEFIMYPNYRESYTQNKFTVAAQSNYKWNAKNVLRSGIILSRIHYSLYKEAKNEQHILEPFVNAGGNSDMAQFYTQWQCRPDPRLTINTGLHALYFHLNKRIAFEPRFSAKYQVGKRSWISTGYGMHNQILPIGTYFYTDKNSNYPNKNLNFSKAQHIVAGYDRMFGRSWHAKAEGYLQLLSNLAVSPETGNTFCIVNSTDGYYSDTLVSKGTGKNYGLELTVEKFFTKNTYLLFSTSISQSKYKDYYGQEFNTRFNVNHTLSLLMGKEWYFGKNRLGANIKLLWTGGLREVPVDVKASVAAGETVRDQTRAFSIQNPDYFRIDTKINYKINKKKHSIIWSLDIQNTTNRKNVWGSTFDLKTQTVQYMYQSPLIPILSYKIEF